MRGGGALLSLFVHGRGWCWYSPLGAKIFMLLYSTNRHQSVFYRFLSMWFSDNVLHGPIYVDRPHYFETVNISVGVCSLHLLSAELASPESG
jgi:hypothetical protein